MCGSNTRGVRFGNACGAFRILRSLLCGGEHHPAPHQVLDTELLFLESLLEGVRPAVIFARVDEHDPPSLRFEVAAMKACPQANHSARGVELTA